MPQRRGATAAFLFLARLYGISYDGGMSTDVQNTVLPDDVILRNIARNVGTLMEQRGVSQHALSRATGDPVMTINGIVKEQHLPRTGVLARIAEALETTVDALISSPEKKSRRAS